LELKQIFGVASAVLASLGGGTLIVWKASDWLGRIWAIRFAQQEKARLDRELEEHKSKLDQAVRAVQTELDRTEYVTKAHFDVEFGALTEIWKNLAEVRFAAVNLRSKEMYTPPNEGENEALRRLTGELKEKFGQFLDAHDYCISVLEHNAPFYPKEIRRLAVEALAITVFEREDVLNERPRFTQEWFASGNKRMADLDSKLSQVEACMRTRIASLTIRP
jgi:hypothetical protein